MRHIAIDANRPHARGSPRTSTRITLDIGIAHNHLEAPITLMKGKFAYRMIADPARRSQKLDKHGGGISSAALERFSRDVFLYTTRADVREEIDRIVANSLTEEPTVIVGHSLGSVVAYSVLRSDRRSLRIPLYLTVGCPLGIRAIRDQFRPLRYPLPVKEWFNAFDTRDIVALHPLDRVNFPVTPEIENYAAVKNSTKRAMCYRSALNRLPRRTTKLQYTPVQYASVWLPAISFPPAVSNASSDTW